MYPDIDMPLVFPATLPISEHVESIAELLVSNQVVIVAGETGSGKSTQLPKIALLAAQQREDVQPGTMVGHTQPRRIAARAVGERIAEEMHTSIGQAVAYTVRFTDTVGPNTLIRVMTDGILLAGLHKDRQLKTYHTIIVDEAHERSLNIDFILGYLKQLLPMRPDLRVIITSATIDTERFAEHFSDPKRGIVPPIVEVSGRTYPVEVRYRPLDEALEETDEDDLDDSDEVRDVTQGVTAACKELLAEGPGDILVFAAGERAIEDAAQALEALNLPNVEILPLFARLSASEQHRVFARHTKRRIVIATNIAETSITVPGIMYVVDPGFARMSRYGRKSKVQRLPVERISQASANQRSGRCGRLGPGIAIRLYSEDNFNARPEFTEPEILRTNLAAVILHMVHLGLSDIEHFPFVEPPDARAIHDGIQSLMGLGALRTERPKPPRRRRALPEPDTQTADLQPELKMTSVGRTMATLPIDPRLARMVIEGAKRQVLDEVIVCTAALTLRDIREYPVEHREHATQMHARFNDPSSDFLTTIALWNYLDDLQTTLSQNQLRKRCAGEFIHFLRYREWRELVRQLCQATHSMRLRTSPTPPHQVLTEHVSDALHQALLSGMLQGLGAAKVGKDMRGRAKEYQGIKGTSFMLGRRSSVAKFAPDWVMAGELVETTGLWASQVAKINPDWIELVARDQVTTTYSEPRWDGARGSAIITQKVQYQGLTIVPARNRQLRTVDPLQARHIFIEQGLVPDDLPARGVSAEILRIQRHNHALVSQALDLESRVRAHGAFDPYTTLQTFLDQAIPDGVSTTQELSQWLRHGEDGLQGKGRRSQAGQGKDAKSPEAQRLARQAREVSLMATLDIILGQDDTDVARGFPDTITVKGHDLQVTYTFDPSQPSADGMTVHIPLSLIAQFEPRDFSWLVPGFRTELIVHLIKHLPKATRRLLTPLNDTANHLSTSLSPEDGDLLSALAHAIQRRIGAPLPHGTLQAIDIPAYLTPRFIVYSGTPTNPTVVATSSDLTALQTGVQGQLQQVVKRVATTLERDNLASLRDMGTLQQTVVQHLDGHTVTGYPACVPSKDRQSFRIRIMPTEATQRSGMRAAHLQDLRTLCPTPLKVISQALPNKDKMVLSNTPYPSAQALAEDIRDAVILEIMAANGGLVWSSEAYDKLADAVQRQWRPMVITKARVVLDIVNEVATLKGLLALPGPRLVVTVPKTAVARRLGRLVYNGFIVATPPDQLVHLPRYIQSLQQRLQALPQQAQRDAIHEAVLTDLSEELDLLALRQIGTPQERDAVYWAIQELHVSLFAQRLGTAQSVSERRIRQAMRALRETAALPKDVS